MEENIFSKLVNALKEEHLTLSSIESFTGGLFSKSVTDISGSSAFVHLNFVTYSNEAKHKILGVSKDTLDKYGAVSKECSFEMARGLHTVTKADICISTTGIAGPTGGSDEKPVGLMYSTIYTPNKSETFKVILDSNIERVTMKEEFVKAVLEKVYTFVLFV